MFHNYISKCERVLNKCRTYNISDYFTPMQDSFWIYTSWSLCSLPLLNTFMLPSADPVTKYSSVGSTAIALTGESWLWSNCCCCFWRRSIIQVKPFLPPDINSWCFGAYASTVAPLSWQIKAERQSNLNKHTVLTFIFHQPLMVQDCSNSDFDAVIQLTTTTSFIVVSYICKRGFTSDILKLQYFQISSYNLYEKQCISFFYPV